MSSLGNKEIMAKNIQYYMDLHQKTRTDMCEALGVKYTTFTDWVKGNSYPRIDKIELMANYFGISKADLVEDKSEREHEDWYANIEASRKLSSNERKELQYVTEKYLNLDEKSRKHVLQTFDFLVKANTIDGISHDIPFDLVSPTPNTSRLSKYLEKMSSLKPIATHEDEDITGNNGEQAETLGFHDFANVGKIADKKDTIKRLGGTMPEDLPTPDKSIQQIERERKQLQKKQRY